MNEFLFWCRHPLVCPFFHEVKYLHPSSFQRNVFSTCIHIIHLFFQTESKKSDVAGILLLLAHSKNVIMLSVGQLSKLALLQQCHKKL